MLPCWAKYKLFETARQIAAQPVRRGATHERLRGSSDGSRPSRPPVGGANLSLEPFSFRLEIRGDYGVSEQPLTGRFLRWRHLPVICRPSEASAVAEFRNFGRTCLGVLAAPEQPRPYIVGSSRRHSKVPRRRIGISRSRRSIDDACQITWVPGARCPTLFLVPICRNLHYLRTEPCGFGAYKLSAHEKAPLTAASGDACVSHVSVGLRSAIASAVGQSRLDPSGCPPLTAPASPARERPRTQQR